MKNLSIAVEFDCPVCDGRGFRPNPDHNPNDLFPEPMLDTCVECEGRKRLKNYIPIEEFLNTVTNLDIPIV